MSPEQLDFFSTLDTEVLTTVSEVSQEAQTKATSITAKVISPEECKKEIFALLEPLTRTNGFDKVF